ncbi:unnamed protein product, partial [Rotaria sp. Silwood1]
MSTCHTSPASHNCSSNDNLETFNLFWLDASVKKTAENVAAQSKLRSIINYLRTFDVDSVCERQIRALSSDDRLVLIVSGGLGRELVPRIIDLPQVSSIYVYCRDKQRNKEWADGFDKVRLVTTDIDKLIHHIKSDQIREIERHEEPLIFS